MRDRRIGERAEDVHQRVGILVRNDVDERFRAPSGSDQIGEFHRRRHPLPRVVHGREPVEP